MLGPLGAAITMQEQRAALDRRQLSPRAPGARDPTSPAGPPGGSPTAPVASRGRVLLLEDEPLISRMLVRLLQRAGFEVSPAATLRDAAAALEGPPLRVAIVDEILPDGAGSSFIARLRADPRHAEARVVCCTGNAIPSVTGRMRELGAQACLSKPFAPAAFTGLIDDCLAEDLPGTFRVV